MGLAFDAVGILLIAISIPLSFGIYKLYIKNESLPFNAFLGEKTSMHALVALLLLLLIPYGVLLLFPIVFILSFVSPAGRMDWSEHRNQRILAIVMVMLMLGVSGFMPVETPSCSR